MASNDVLTLQDSTFDQEVLKGETPFLVDFWAVWCQPCKAIAPTVEQVAADFKGKLRVGKLNVDEFQLTARKYGIRSLPTLLLFKGGRVVDTLVGNFNGFKSKLEESVRKAVGG
jgi:thioredoxin 1